MTPAALSRLVAHALRVCALLGLLGLPAVSAGAASQPTQVLQSALAVASEADHFPDRDPDVAEVSLPDDWSSRSPRLDGTVWYRVRFDPAAGIDRSDLLALYVPRVCSNFEVFLNGRLIHRGGSMQEPLTRNCHYPQLVPLPGGLLLSRGNVLDLKVRGHALQRVAARQRAAGLSELMLGEQGALRARQEQDRFWNVDMVAAANLALAVLGAVLVVLAWLNRREAAMGYFGLMALGWAALSGRLWWRDIPLDGASVEFLVCLGFTPILALAVQFLLSHANVRSRVLEAALLAQCVILPMSLLLAGPARLFELASAWYLVLAAEGVGAMVLYLRITWRERRNEFWTMAPALAAAGGVLLFEVAVQRGWLAAPPVALLQFVMPMLMVALALRLLMVFGRQQRHVDLGRHAMEARIREITTEVERNYAQLAEMRVEQVTQQERKRIAADLHDDLGAKLLTIVHTSESERISTLAREALEEMRLSVRGLTGKPVRLADALADWRAETVSRLGQANVEIDWRSLAEETEQVLPARGYVQTTRILREAVSNIIKHSGASHCKVRCAIADGQFGINIQDNGKGIPMELDGKLDRGHGMSSMKHRAKQMQGQCLVESGPGYGTVIRLTLPLGPELPAGAAR
ncbi:MAG: histidine kinase [Piscinibacter sp.]|nr:histidine kinase [Piscinibacter sp.]